MTLLIHKTPAWPSPYRGTKHFHCLSRALFLMYIQILTLCRTLIKQETIPPNSQMVRPLPPILLATVNSPLPLRIRVTSCLSQRLRTDHWGSWRGSGQEPSEAYHISTETRGDWWLNLLTFGSWLTATEQERLLLTFVINQLQFHQRERKREIEGPVIRAICYHSTLPSSSSSSTQKHAHDANALMCSLADVAWCWCRSWCYGFPLF